MDGITETDQDIIKIIEVILEEEILEEEILEEIHDQIGTIEVKIIEVDIEGILEMIITKR